MSIIVAAYTGGLTTYDLHSESGDLEIVKSYYQYENGKLENRSTTSYTADFWQYTEEGYLLFTGSYFSQDYYIFSMNNVPSCTALRIQPLDEKCRELNRKYILPVGYSKNNMFISDWNEQDFGSLDFYDLFDKFYLLKNGENSDGTITLTVNAVYPERKKSKAFAHEAVIRPLAKDGFQYVSYKVLPPEDNKGQTWHRPRLTEVQWEEFYEDYEKM